jgi:SAM-dependent methyltransferase
MKHSCFAVDSGRAAHVALSLSAPPRAAEGAQDEMRSFEFRHDHGGFSPAHSYLVPKIERILRDICPATVFEIGAGNGSIARHLAKRYDVVGIEPSASGIE